MSDYEVIHNKEEQEFSIDFEGHQCVLQYRELADNALEYFKTFVPEEARGHGLAQKLAKYALTYAKDQNLKVKPVCWFIDKYMTKHTEFADLRVD